MSGIGRLVSFTIDNLYGGYVTNGKWSQAKYDQYMIARAVLPLYAAYADYEIGKQQNQWYFDRYGKDWSGVQSPWNLPGYNEQQRSVSNTYNYVSNNLKRLYR